MVARAERRQHDLPYEDIDAPGPRATPYRRLIARAGRYYRADDLDRILPLGVVESLALPGRELQARLHAGPARRGLPPRSSPPRTSSPTCRMCSTTRAGMPTSTATAGGGFLPGGVLRAARVRRRAELAQARRAFLPAAAVRDPFGNATTVAYDPHDLMPVRDPRRGRQHRSGRRSTTACSRRRLDDRREPQPLRGRVRRAGHGRRHRGHGQAGPARGRLARRVRRRPRRGHDPRASRRPAPRPARDPASRPPRGSSTTCSPTTAPATRPARAGGGLHARPRDARRDLAPGQQTKVQHAFLVLRRLRPRDPEEDPGRARSARRSGGPESTRAGSAAAGRSSTTRGNRSASTSRSSAPSHAFEFANVVGVSSIAVLRSRASASSRRSTPTIPTRRWSSTRGGRATGTSTTPCLQINPAQDPDVGDFFAQTCPRRLPADLVRRSAARASSARRNSKRPKTAVHANTPSVAYLDTLGRTFLTVAHNRFERAGVPVERILRDPDRARHRRATSSRSSTPSAAWSCATTTTC